VVSELTLEDAALRVPGLALMLARRSEAKLGEPAPSVAELEFALQLAATAPDHRQVTPYRAVVLWPDVLTELVERIERTRPEDAERARITVQRAPVFVVMVFSPDTANRTRVEEQRDAAAAATSYLLLALAGLGYGSMWRTGRLASDPELANLVELADHEQVIALVGVGSSLGIPAHPRARRAAVRHLGHPA
jgi:nitroreductase